LDSKPEDKIFCTNDIKHSLPPARVGGYIESVRREIGVQKERQKTQHYLESELL